MKVKKYYIIKFIFLILAFSANYVEASNIDKGIVAFLSSQRSGSNLISCSLLAIIRKPIGMLCSMNIHPVANYRLKLNLLDSFPFLYRTHEVNDLKNLSHNEDKLIFVTRNPKELFFRECSASSIEEINYLHLTNFIDIYLERFKKYESWNPKNRFLVFYEDFINQQNEEILIKLLNFIDEEPVFFYDYITHKEEYLSQILNSYKEQHKGTSGQSCLYGPRSIYYTQNKTCELLKCIDKIIEEKEPKIWKKYLKRFETK